MDKVVLSAYHGVNGTVGSSSSSENRLQRMRRDGVKGMPLQDSPLSRPESSESKGTEARALTSFEKTLRKILLKSDKSVGELFRSALNDEKAQRNIRNFMGNPSIGPHVNDIVAGKYDQAVVAGILEPLLTNNDYVKEFIDRLKKKPALIFSKGSNTDFRNAAFTLSAVIAYQEVGRAVSSDGGTSEPKRLREKHEAYREYLQLPGLSRMNMQPLHELSESDQAREWRERYEQMSQLNEQIERESQYLQYLQYSRELGELRNARVQPEHDRRGGEAVEVGCIDWKGFKEDGKKLVKRIEDTLKSCWDCCCRDDESNRPSRAERRRRDNYTEGYVDGAVDYNSGGGSGGGGDCCIDDDCCNIQ